MASNACQQANAKRLSEESFGVYYKPVRNKWRAFRILKMQLDFQLFTKGACLMQPYKTIVGVIELSNDKQPYGIVQQRYGIGSSTVTHIMKRFKELELSLDDLKKMEPGKVDPFHPVLTWND